MVERFQTPKFIQKAVAFLLLFLTTPLFLLIWLAVKLEDGGALFFNQPRVGKDGDVFLMHKFRTMIPEAEKLQKKLKHLNEADGPVFKIYDDPRYTRVGKFLAHTGLDELPQLINIIKGEMGFVGPRPLPLSEAEKIPPKYRKRFSVLPGITSLWVIRGAHKLSFDEWMMADLEYARKRGLFLDLRIIFSTVFIIIKSIGKEFRQLLRTHKEKDNENKGY